MSQTAPTVDPGLRREGMPGLKGKNVLVTGADGADRVSVFGTAYTLTGGVKWSNGAHSDSEDPWAHGFIGFRYGFDVDGGLVRQFSFGVGGGDLPIDGQGQEQLARNEKVGFRNSVHKCVQFAAADGVPAWHGSGAGVYRNFGPEDR